LYFSRRWKLVSQVSEEVRDRKGVQENMLAAKQIMSINAARSRKHKSQF
jgi:hypothetical protein